MCTSVARDMILFVLYSMVGVYVFSFSLSLCLCLSLSFCWENGMTSYAPTTTVVKAINDPSAMPV